MSVTTAGRVQLALNVTDLEASIEFYSKLFDAEPAKTKPGYANFAIEEPPLKLVLIENSDGGSINHLGVEVDKTEAVDAAAQRFDVQGMATDIEQATSCCYAVQDKVWVTGPDAERWEYYTVLADAENLEQASTTNETECCGPLTVAS